MKKTLFLLLPIFLTSCANGDYVSTAPNSTNSDVDSTDVVPVPQIEYVAVLSAQQIFAAYRYEIIPNSDKYPMFIIDWDTIEMRNLTLGVTTVKSISSDYSLVYSIMANWGYIYFKQGDEELKYRVNFEYNIELSLDQIILDEKKYNSSSIVPEAKEDFGEETSEMLLNEFTSHIMSCFEIINNAFKTAQEEYGELEYIQPSLNSRDVDDYLLSEVKDR